MKFTQVDQSVVKLKATRQHNYEFLKEFDESGIVCAEVTNYSHAHAKSCLASLKKTIERYRMVWLGASIRDGKVYIYRVNKMKM